MRDRRPRLLTLILGTLLLPPLLHPSRAAGSDFTGRYECTEVVESGEIVSMTFSLSVVSHRSEEIAGATLRLLDASDAGVVYAEFPALNLSEGVDVPLMASVTLERSEWDRWQSGAPPRVRIEAFASDGTDQSAMVDLVLTSFPEVTR